MLHDLQKIIIKKTKIFLGIILCLSTIFITSCDQNPPQNVIPNYTPIDAVLLIDNSMSPKQNFIVMPTEEQLFEFYDVFGKTGGSIQVGQIGTSKISLAPYKSYYDLKLKIAVPSSGALYEEKMADKIKNKAEKESYEKRKAQFVSDVHALYRFDLPLTEISSAVKKAVGNLKSYLDSDERILIIQSDMIQDLGRPEPYKLFIPSSIQVYIIGRSASARVSFNPDAHVHYFDSFNEFLHNFKTIIR